VPLFGAVDGRAEDLLIAIIIGAASIEKRDSAIISASAAIAPTTTTVKVKAQGSGLRSDEFMLVQVTALPSDFPQTRDGFFESGALCSVDRFGIQQAPSNAGPLLQWSQAGPTSDGTATLETSIDVPTGRFKGVCVLALYAPPSTPILPKR
jgi:hypothetical protein